MVHYSSSAAVRIDDCLVLLRQRPQLHVHRSKQNIADKDKQKRNKLSFDQSHLFQDWLQRTNNGTPFELFYWLSGEGEESKILLKQDNIRQKNLSMIKITIA